jgi:hypothetical protein
MSQYLKLPLTPSEIYNQVKRYGVIHAPYSDSYLHYLENFGEGALLEGAIKDVFSSLNANVEEHYTQDHGLDTKAHFNGFDIGCEALDWYGGFIHPERWNRIVRNLRGCGIKFLFAFGVKPTKVQYAKAEKEHIHIIHFPRRMDVFDEDKPSIVNWLKRKIIDVLSVRGVITTSTTFNDGPKTKSPSDTRVNVSSKVMVLFVGVMGFLGFIKLKIRRIADKNHDSLPKSKSNDGQVQSSPTEFRCCKCGSHDNEKLRSMLYCDACAIKLVIGSLIENEFISQYPRKELGMDDYAV